MGDGDRCYLHSQSRCDDDETRETDSDITTSIQVSMYTLRNLCQCSNFKLKLKTLSKASGNLNLNIVLSAGSGSQKPPTSRNL